MGAVVLAVGGAALLYQILHSLGGESRKVRAVLRERLGAGTSEPGRGGVGAGGGSREGAGRGCSSWLAVLVRE